MDIFVLGKLEKFEGEDIQGMHGQGAAGSFHLPGIHTAAWNRQAALNNCCMVRTLGDARADTAMRILVHWNSDNKDQSDFSLHARRRRKNTGRVTSQLLDWFNETQCQHGAEFPVSHSGYRWNGAISLHDLFVILWASYEIAHKYRLGLPEKQSDTEKECFMMEIKISKEITLC